MFAEFNPGVYTVNSNVEEETRIKETEKITNSLISEGPAISSQVNIRPPQDRTVRKLYNQDEKEKELENLLNEEVETPKESVFTKIFKAFSKK